MDITGSSMLAAPYIQGPYGPMLVSPEVVPYAGWTPYPAPVRPVVSPIGQSSTQAGPMYRSSNQLSPSAPAYQGAYQATSSTTRPSSSSKKEQKFPEKPGQPECQYYMRTGDCKFGSTCKCHHPPERSIGETNCILSPIGLPLRPTSMCSRMQSLGLITINAAAQREQKNDKSLSVAGEPQTGTLKLNHQHSKPISKSEESNYVKENRRER